MATEDPSGHTARASTLGPWPSGAPGHVALAAGPPSGRSGRGVPRLGERISAAVEKRGPYMVMRVPSIQAKLQKHRDLAKAVLRRKCMLGASPNCPDSSGKRSVKFNKGYTALSQGPDENLVSLNSDRAVFFGALFHPKMACLEDSEDSCCSWIWNTSLVWENHPALMCLALLVTVTLSLLEPLKEPFVLSKFWACVLCDGELESRYSSGYSSAEVNQDMSRQLLQDGYHLDEIPDDEDLDLIPPKPMASSTCSCCWCCLGDSFSCSLQ